MIPVLEVGFYYKYKGISYFVEKEAKLKIGQVWIPCVVYSNGSLTYVRELEDFLVKFIKC